MNKKYIEAKNLIESFLTPGSVAYLEWRNVDQHSFICDVINSPTPKITAEGIAGDLEEYVKMLYFEKE